LNGELHGAVASKDPKRILDSGVGSGIWAIDKAEKYPDCGVLGIYLGYVMSADEGGVAVVWCK